MSAFELFHDREGRYRFRLRANNHEPISASEGYTTKDSATNGVASVRKHAPFDASYQRIRTNAGWHFNLRADNHEVIATSEVYASEGSCELGIAAVKREAVRAPLVDLT